MEHKEMTTKTTTKFKIRALADRVCISMGVLMVLATMVNAWKPFTFSYVLNMGDLGVFNLGFTHLILVVAAIGVVMMFAVWNRNAPYLALLASLTVSYTHLTLPTKA